jgi:hypothetical protein
LPCKSHPITTIQYRSQGSQEEKTVSETGLDPKYLAHILTHDRCRQAVNEKLKNDLKVTIKRVPENFGAMKVFLEDEAVSENMGDVYRVIDGFCKERLRKSEHDIDKQKFAFADFKMAKFLEGMEDLTRVSIFFDEKLSLVGSEAGIEVFEAEILSSILNDEVIRDSIKVDGEQLLYLKVIRYPFQILKEFEVEVTLEDEDGGGKIELNGLREDVVNVQRNVPRYLQGYKKRFWSKQLTKDELTLLQEKRARHHLNEVFKRNKSLYLIVEDKLFMVTQADQTEEMKKRLEDALFFEKTRRLCALERNLFNSEKWTTNRTVLWNNTKRQVIVTVEGDELLITCLPHVKTEVENFVESFLQENTKSKLIKWECSKDVKEFFQKFKCPEILESKEDSVLSICVEDDGIRVRGTESGITDCQQVLATVVNEASYYRAEYAVSSEQVAEHFITLEGEQSLQEVGMRTRSVIRLKNRCKIRIKRGSIASEEVSNKKRQKNSTDIK